MSSPTKKPLWSLVVGNFSSPSADNSGARGGNPWIATTHCRERGSATWIVLVIVFVLGAGLNIMVAEAARMLWPLLVSLVSLAAGGSCLFAWREEDRRPWPADVDEAGTTRVGS
jgi:hypothetical protein